MRFSWCLSLLLILYVGPLSAFWWNSSPVTKAPTVDNDTSVGGMTSKEEKIADVGSEIIDVARGIQGFVKNWDQNSTVDWNNNVTVRTPVISSKLLHSKTGNNKSLSEEVEHEINVKGSSGDAIGSGLGSGLTMDLAQEGKTTATNLTGTRVTDAGLA